MGVRTLEEKTQAFWSVSSEYNAPRPTLTVEQAIKTLGDIEDETSSQKCLAKKATHMLDEIIGFPPPEEEELCEGVFEPDWCA